MLLIVEAIVCITSPTTPPAIIIPVFCTVGTDDLATPLLTAVARPATVAPNPILLPILLIYWSIFSPVFPLYVHVNLYLYNLFYKTYLAVKYKINNKYSIK